MEIKQETKSLPRNRKCGNCRYFEPAPLWRKGWCRNPRLYDRRANHLVDAATIDCEQVFRARIYWEPVPVPSRNQAEPPIFAGLPESRPPEILHEPYSADGGSQIRENRDGVLRPTSTRPVINRREKAAATPNLVKKSSSTRKWLLDNIPYYDKVDGPVHRLNLKLILPWLIAFILLVIILVNVTGGKKDSGISQAGITGVSATATLSNGGSPGAKTNPALPGTAGANLNSQATATLSNALPTATQVPPSPTPQAKTLAKVVNTGGKGANMRSEPHITTPNEKSNIVSKVVEGDQVEITGPFKTSDGINWWPVSYKGQNGWLAQDYLQKLS